MLEINTYYFMIEKTYRLTISCPDGVGIVAAVGQFLADHGGWISEANHHSDPITKHFFMRQEILADSLNCSIETLRTAFIPIAEKFAMDWQLVDASQPKKVVLCVSKQAHCLNDLLYRWRSKELFLIFLVSYLIMKTFVTMSSGMGFLSTIFLSLKIISQKLLQKWQSLLMQYRLMWLF